MRHPVQERQINNVLKFRRIKRQQASKMMFAMLKEKAFVIKQPSVVIISYACSNHSLCLLVSSVSFIFGLIRYGEYRYSSKKSTIESL